MKGGLYLWHGKYKNTLKKRHFWEYFLENDPKKCIFTDGNFKDTLKKNHISCVFSIAKGNVVRSLNNS